MCLHGTSLFAAHSRLNFFLPRQKQKAALFIDIDDRKTQKKRKIDLKQNNFSAVEVVSESDDQLFGIKVYMKLLNEAHRRRLPHR